jgi:hypothetical protein
VRCIYLPSSRACTTRTSGWTVNNGCS